MEAANLKSVLSAKLILWRSRKDFAFTEPETHSSFIEKKISTSRSLKLHVCCLLTSTHVMLFIALTSKMPAGFQEALVLEGTRLKESQWLT